MTFTAVVTLASDSFTPCEKQKAQYGHGQALYPVEYGLLLDKIQVWDPLRLVIDLVPTLTSIENKENWGAYFQGGVLMLDEENFRVIVDNRGLAPLAFARTQEDVFSESRFALEEFIDNNWKYIRFRSDLVKYEVDNKPAGNSPLVPGVLTFFAPTKSPAI